MAKIINWMKMIGSALLTGAKAVTVAEGMVGNLVAEGVGELFEQGFHSVGEKIKLNQLLKSIEKKFKDLVDKYGEEFLDELYRDLCNATDNSQEKKKSGASCKDYTNLFVSSMDNVNEKTLASLPCCQKLSENDKTLLVSAFSEFKKWLTQRLLTSMSFKEQAFIQIVAQKVVNELSGDLSRVVLQLRTEFYEDILEPLTECPNCHASENDLEYKQAEKIAVCKKCGKSFYVGKKTKQASVFQSALEKTLKDVEAEIVAIDARLCEIEKNLAVLANENEQRKWNARVNLRYAVKAKNPDPDRVEAAAQELRKFNPDDPFALYFFYALQDDRGDVCSFLEQASFCFLDQEERHFIANFAIGGLKHSTEISSVRIYLKGAFTEGTNEYQEYQQWLDEEAAKTYDGVYDVDLERDAFIMYVSEDLPLVRQLVCFLEEKGLKCFYSERNLQHIYKRKESRYMEKIMKAMDNCKTIIFVSTETARSKYDGGHIDEMKRRIESERNFARRQYNNNNLSYADIRDNNIKKPRIEWVVGTPRDINGQRNIYIKQFFGDLVNGGVTMDVIAEFVFEHSIPSGESVPTDKTSTTPTVSTNANSPTAKNTKKSVSTTATKQTSIARPSVVPAPKKNVQPTKADKNLGKLYEYNVLKDGTAELVLLEGAETLNLPTTVDGYKVTKISKGTFFKNEDIIRKIIIPHGVTTINDNAFGSFRSLKSVAIPNSVTVIGKNAFCACHNLTSVTIPNGVTSIGKEAFSYCKNLMNVTIPDSVISIGERAFYECEFLLDVTVSKNNTVYQSIDGSLYSKGGKTLIQYAVGKLDTSFTLPNSVTEIGKEAFKGCKSLTNVIFPSGLITIGEDAFFCCENLTDVTIPDSVTKIGKRAFYGCSFTSITVPERVVSIGVGAFNSCSHLKTISVSEKNTQYLSIDGNLYLKKDWLDFRTTAENKTELFTVKNRELIQYAIGKTDTAFTVPDDVTSIGYGACKNCKNLTTVILSDKVSCIDEDAFSYCQNLTNVSFSKVLTKIGKRSFEHCVSLTNVTLPNSVHSIDAYAFRGCNFTSITLPYSVTSIGDGAFENCKNLTSITIPKHVHSIGSRAFEGCKKLTVYCETAKKPSGWKEDWADGLFGKKAVKKIVWDCKNAPQKRAAKKRSVKNVFGFIFGAIAFILGVFLIAYPWVNPVVFGAKTGTTWLIADISFFVCATTFFVLCGDFIGSDVFDSSLGIWLSVPCALCFFISLLFPISIRTESVFYEWYYWLFVGLILFFILLIAAFTWISVGSKHGVTDFFGWLVIGLFLTSVVLSVGVPVHHKRTYGKNESTAEASYTYTTLENGSAEIVVCKGAETLEIPSVIDGHNVTKISCAENVKNALAVKTLVLPETVEEFSPTAFINYINLTNVRYTGSLENWCSLFFDSAKQNPMSYAENLYIDGKLLTNLFIPDTVTGIKPYAFYGCESLTSVIIPNSVTSIGYSAFYNCDNLESVTIGESVTSISNYAFYDCNSLTVINYNATECADLNKYQVFSGAEHSGYRITVTIGRKVKKIPSYLFSLTSKIKNLDFEENSECESIGNYAFYDCNNLTNITIPDSVTSIANTSFSGCSALQNATLPLSAVLYIPTTNLQTLVVTSGERIAPSAFSNCKNLTNVTLPESVTEMGFGAFSGCKNLKNLTVPFVGNTQNGATNTHFGYVFGANFYLENKAHVPASLKNVTVLKGNLSGKRIMQYSFYNCDSLTSVTLPDGIVSIEDYAFHGCKALAIVNVPETVTEIGDSSFEYCQNLTSTTIGNNVYSIGKNAFLNCSGLTDLIISENVSTIGENAFKNCSALTNVTLPNVAFDILSVAKENLKTVTLTSGETVKAHAFENFKKLSSINLPESIVSIEDYAFFACENLTDVNIPSGVNKIGSNAFNKCKKLTSVKIPEGVSQICEQTFYFCSALTNVTIGNNVNSIGKNAFSHCTNLTDLTIPKNVSNIGNSAFYGCNNLTNVIIEDGVNSIDDWAFSNCNKITELTIPKTIITIGDWAFYGCGGLRNVTVSNGVSIIGDSTFQNCSALTNVTLGNSITTIGYSAFVGCKSLTSVTIPASVTSIGYFAFDDCNKLTEINVADGNTKYASINGHLYLKDGKKLIRYAPANTTRSFTLQDDVTTIESKAFANSLYLTDINVSQNNAYFSSLDGNLYSKDGKTLVQYALGKAAQSFSFPNTVTNVEHYAFNGCETLTSITLTENVTSIGYAVFGGCTNLKYNEENGLKYLGTTTNKYLCLIAAADDVTTATINESCKVIGYGAFDNHTKLESVSIPDSVIYVNYYAFSNCDSLTSVTIGKNVTTIEYGAFSECDNLASVTLPDSLTTIGLYAFSGCNNLTSIIIPISVTYMRRDAFSNCINLTIYCEAASELVGTWEPDWDWNVKKVVWGYTGN